MLKILHLADLHLDSRFVGFDVTEATKRRAQLRDIFKSALDFAKKEGCSATLICGDLFDGEYYTSDTLRFLSECFKSMPEHLFFITPGNHDPHGPSSPYRFADFPKNVHIFKSEELSCVTVDRLKLNVYGYAFVEQSYAKNPLEHFYGAKNNGYFNILCAHTELDGATPTYAPIQRKSFDGSGFDYAALGHVHNESEIGKIGGTLYAYSGCIAGRDFTEHGEKGGILIALNEKNGKKSVEATKIKLCPWVYETVSVSIEGAENIDSAQKIIKEKLKHYSTKSSEYLIRLNITGEIGFEINLDLLSKNLSEHGVKAIKNNTRPMLSDLNLENDFSLRGAFYRVLKPKLSSDNEQERKTAELALKYGLTALGRGEIDV